jgi:hypothetical protein
LKHQYSPASERHSWQRQNRGAQAAGSRPLFHDTNHKPLSIVAVSIIYSRSHDPVIHVYDAAGKLIEVHRHKEDFKEP